MKKIFVSLLCLILIVSSVLFVWGSEFDDGREIFISDEQNIIQESDFQSSNDNSFSLFEAGESESGLLYSEIEEVNLDDTLLMEAGNDYTQWKQYDAAWNQQEAWPATAYPNASLRTMAKGGCLVTSIAMLLRQYNVITTNDVTQFNPWICNETLKSAGAFNSAADLYFNLNNAYAGFEYQNKMSYSLSNITNLFNQGYACVVEVGGSGGYLHYVAVKNVSGSIVTIMDPGSGNTNLDAYGAKYSIYYYKVKASESPTISGYNVPPNLNAGQAFSIYGTIFSSTTLTSVTVGVYDISGNSKTSKTVNPNSTSYDIHNVDSAIYFNALAPGSYVYKVMATNASGTYTLINSAFSVIGDTSSIPYGSLDEVNGGEGYIHVRGWAIDNDIPTQAIEIHVYVGGIAGSGAPGYSIIADAERTDVGNVYPSAGNYHGFDSVIPVSVTGMQTIYVYALNVGGENTNPLLGCKEVTISPARIDPPEIYNIEAGVNNEEGYTITCEVSSDSGIDKVQFETWTEANGQDDLVVCDGSLSGNKFTGLVKRSDHNNEYGTYITCIYAYDKSGNSTSKNIRVDLEEPLNVSISVNPMKSVVYGNTVTLSAAGKGGTGSYLYKFLVCDEAGNWYKIRDYASENTCKWTPGAVGTKVLYVDVKDSSGNYKRQSLSYEVTAKPLTVSFSASPSGSTASGNKVTLTASAGGGSGSYTYKFLVCDAAGNWYKIRDYAEGKTCIWYPGSAGKKTLYVDVKDNSGNYKRQSLSYEVTSKPLSVSFGASPSGSAVSGSKVTLTASADGGSGSYTYKFLVCDAAGNWYKIRDYAAGNTCTWYPGSAGKKTLYVDVKDSKGQTVRKELGYTVNAVQESLSVNTFTCLAGTVLPTYKSVTLTANASGGSGNYQYRFQVYNTLTGQTYMLRDFAGSNTFTWNTGAAATKKLFVIVKDSRGNLAQKVINVNVSDELKVDSFESSKGLVISKGETTVLTAKANGGTGSLQYKFIVCDENENWFKLRDYGSSNTFNWSTAIGGRKTLYVDVKDQAGKVVRKELKVIVLDEALMTSGVEMENDIEMFTGSPDTEQKKDDIEHVGADLKTEMSSDIEETKQSDLFSSGEMPENDDFDAGVFSAGE